MIRHLTAGVHSSGFFATVHALHFGKQDIVFFFLQFIFVLLHRPSYFHFNTVPCLNLKGFGAFGHAHQQPTLDYFAPYVFTVGRLYKNNGRDLF